MGKTCYGCMQEKNASPVCEHCGFDERQRNERHQLPMGIVLRQQYVVGRALGQGGFGITYIGWDMNLDMPVAIKEFYPGSLVSRDCTMQTEVRCYTNGRAAYEDSKNRFLREAQALAKFMNVPEIVRVQSFFEENGTAYIVMEYVQGTDLRKYLRGRQQKPAAAEVLELMRPVMQAMTVVHKAGLVHRDISPDNIMIMPDGSIKLLDFGAVREVENPGVDKELTHSTQAILKHGFAPLEQYQAKGKLGPWTDVYALCATMYYCMTGKVPPEAHDRMLDNASIDWAQVPGLTKQQAATLEKGMALLPKDRITSVQELYEGLYLTSGAVPEEQPPKKSPVREEVKSPETKVENNTYQMPEIPVDTQETNQENTGKEKKAHPILWGLIAVVLFGALKVYLSIEQIFLYNYKLSGDLYSAVLILFAAVSVLIPVAGLLLRKKRKPGQYVWLALALTAFSLLTWTLDDILSYIRIIVYYPAWKCFCNMITVNLCMLALNVLDGETEKSANTRKGITVVAVSMMAFAGVEFIYCAVKDVFQFYSGSNTILVVLVANFPFLLMHMGKNMGVESARMDKLRKCYPAVLLVLSVLAVWAAIIAMPLSVRPF